MIKMEMTEREAAILVSLLPIAIEVIARQSTNESVLEFWHGVTLGMYNVDEFRSLSERARMLCVELQSVDVSRFKK